MKYFLILLICFAGYDTCSKKTPVFDTVRVQSGTTPATAVWSQSEALIYKESGFKLHAAVADGDYERVRALIAAGWDVNAQAWDGKFPLHLAGDEDMEQLLIESGSMQ